MTAETIRRATKASSADAWQAWTAHLARRTTPEPLARLLPGKSWPLGWNLPDGLAPASAALLEEIGTWLARPRKGPPLAIDPSRWLAEAAPGRPDVGYAYEVLAWIHALPRLAAQLDMHSWLGLLHHLAAASAEATRLAVEEHPLVHQLLAGEAALALAWQLPEFKACQKRAASARLALSAGMAELLDGEGMPHADYLALLRPLAACWLRSWALARATGREALDAKGRNQFAWVVRNLIRLARRDGSQVFSTGSQGGWNRPLFEAALELGGDEDDRRMALAALPDSKKLAGGTNTSVKKVALPGYHSEWAAVGVLRPNWTVASPSLTVLYPRAVVTEMNCGSDRLWSGEWELEVRVNGEPAPVTGQWEEICWQSDSEVDYLELQIDLAGEVIVQRHCFVAREDRFMILADAILGPASATQIDYVSRLPLGPEIRWEAASETTEARLHGAKPRALVLPLALPEWRSAALDGELVLHQGRMELRQQARAPRLFAPLFFDLDRPRAARPFTWRQLTVAENRVILPRHLAVGYRVQCGTDQWFLYRTLGPKGNRSLLGHNLASSMLFGRFTRKGDVETLLEIE